MSAMTENILLCALIALAALAAGVLLGRSFHRFLPLFDRLRRTHLDETQLYALYDAQLFDRALTLCDGVLEKHPRDVEALFNRGLCLVQLERYDEALACFYRMDRLRPDDLRAQHQMAFCLFRAGMPHGALACMDAVCERQPSECAFVLSRADVLSDLGRQEEALAAYRSVRLPDDPESRISAAWGKGTCYLRNQQPREAIAELEKALEAGCEDPECRLMLSQAYFDLGEHQQALDAALRQIMLTPADSAAYLQAARVLMAMENYREALQYLEQADTRTGEPLHYEKARCLCPLGREEEAMALLAELLEHQSDVFRGYLALHGPEDFPTLWQREDFRKMTAVNEK